MHSNCFVWARVTYWRELRRWRSMGRPRGIEPVLMKRPSRLEPRAVLGIDVPHYLVSYCVDYAKGRMVTQSYVPADTSDLAWHQIWRALWFPGYVQTGDDHWKKSQPPRL